MPCAASHRLINFTVTTGYLASRPVEEQRGIAHPLIGGTASAALASLPDFVEPAIHPHHRQFFHSVLFAGLLGYGVYRAYRWTAETPLQKVLRIAVMLGGSAYLLHLAADALTTRSLPLIGK